VPAPPWHIRRASGYLGGVAEPQGAPREPEPREDGGRQRWRRLAALVVQAETSGVRALTPAQLVELPRAYREASSELARLEAHGDDPRLATSLRSLVARAHALLHAVEQPAQNPLVRAARFLLVASPRAIRAEWKLGLSMLLAFYGLAAIAFTAVSNDLELAFSLLAPDAVATEIAQLRSTEEGQPFKGNFTFGLGESPHAAGMILAHNMWISVLFFGAGLLPPLFLWMLATNALMVGTYTAVAGHWGQAGEISSILWCHGTIELQMIVLAGMGGLVLVRAWIAPGPWSRAYAMALESRRAWALLAPVFPLLFLSGLIEGFVSPHAPTPVRTVVALTSLAGLALWIGLGGRAPRAPTART
jgi:uncharacterized membrane protein SpoIIM required for sporulation